MRLPGKIIAAHPLCCAACMQEQSNVVVEGNSQPVRKQDDVCSCVAN